MIETAARRCTAAAKPLADLCDKRLPELLKSQADMATGERQLKEAQVKQAADGTR